VRDGSFVTKEKCNSLSSTSHGQVRVWWECMSESVCFPVKNLSCYQQFTPVCCFLRSIAFIILRLRVKMLNALYFVLFQRLPTSCQLKQTLCEPAVYSSQQTPPENPSIFT